MRELYAPKQSVIHQLDARVKLIFALAFVVFLSLSPSGAWHVYILYLAIILSLTLISRVGLRLAVGRALLALPFAAAAFPLIFMGPLPHSSWQVLQKVSVVYSPEGLERFVSIVIKSLISAQAVVLLSATTHFADLLSAAQHLHMPKLLAAIIGLMWRYLFVISEEAARMMRAMASRSAVISGFRHGGGNIVWRARVAGGMAGSLFLRSLERSDRVFAAMLSRGYTGDLAAWDGEPLSGGDRRLLGLGLLILALVWALGLMRMG